MNNSDVIPAIGQQRNWKEHVNATGEYWHPVFWSFLESHPDISADPEWYPARLDHFQLDTQTYYLGDGQPAQHEQPLLARWRAGDKSAIRDWVPQLGPSGVGWFILTVQDSDLAPFVVWARQRDDVTPGLHPIVGSN